MSLAYLHVFVLLSAHRVYTQYDEHSNMGYFDINIPSLSPQLLTCRTKKMMVVKYFYCVHVPESSNYVQYIFVT